MNTSRVAIVPRDVKSDFQPQKERLLSLAQEINTCHASAVEAVQRGFLRAIQAGKNLIEAKRLLGHGNWNEWVKTNCPSVSQRSAQIYMQVARAFGTQSLDQYKTQPETVAAALKKLAAPTKSAGSAHLQKSDSLPTRWAPLIDADDVKELLKALLELAQQVTRCSAGEIRSILGPNGAEEFRVVVPPIIRWLRELQSVIDSP